MDDKDRSVPNYEFDTKKLILQLNLALPADVRHITPVVEKVMWVVKEVKCGAGKEFEIETALREALANAIVHGCKKDRDKEIQLAVACDESRGVMMIVRDPGEGFDPEALPSPLRGECLFAEHGRGIFLINELMDEVQFKKGGTEIRMRKN